MYRGESLQMERQVSQTSQWSKTCIREGGLRWKNEYSNQVSEIKLVSGRELTDGKMSEATGSVK